MTLCETFPLIAYDPTAEAHPRPWIIETLVMRGKIGALLGPEKVGKSRLLCWWLAALYTEQTAVIGQRIHQASLPRKALYVAGEEQTEEDIFPRLACYAAEMGHKGVDMPIQFMEASGMGLDRVDRRRELGELLQSGHFDWLILEPMRRLHDADEDKSTPMAPIHNTLRAWSNRFGVSITIIHHTGKRSEEADMNRIATWARGTSDLATLLDTACFIEEKTRKDGQRRLRMLRAGRFPPVDALLLDDFGDPRGFAAAHYERT